MRNVYILWLMSIVVAQAQTLPYTKRSGVSTGQSTKRILVNKALALPAASAAVPDQSASLRIFQATTSAKPGQIIYAQGAFSASARLFSVSGDKLTELPIVKQIAGYLHATIPTSFVLDSYTLYVYDGGKRSPFFYVNQSQGLYFDTNQASPGANLGIIGRNLLLLANATPTIRFVPVSSSTTSITATYTATGSTKQKINVTVPAGLRVGMSYLAYITNGSSAGETKVDDTLTCLSPGNDVYQLGLGWGSKFSAFSANIYNIKTDTRLARKAVGDSLTNDLPAFEAAIEAATQAGGGVVYVPEGRYRLAAATARFWGLWLKSNVVIAGAGMGQTRLIFGTGAAVTKCLIVPLNYNVIGLFNLSVVNVSNADRIGNSFGLGLVLGSDFFVQNCSMEGRYGDCLALYGLRNTIQNSQIKGWGNSALHHGPLGVNTSTYAVVRNNVVTMAEVGIDAGDALKCIIEYNTVNRDVTLPLFPGASVHLVILGGSRKGLYRQNKLLVINGAINRTNNDGESFIAEDSGTFNQESGSVGSASATTLTDPSKVWSTTFVVSRPSVTIIAGKGLGQWREVVARTTKTITISQAWDIIPDATSKYALFNAKLVDVTIASNYIENQQRGITLYDAGMHNVVVEDNSLLNSGSIDVTPFQLMGKNQRFTPSFGILLANNACRSDTDPVNGTFIGVHPVQHVQTKTIGTLCLGMEIQDNTIWAATPNKTAVVDNNYPNGILNYLEYHTLGDSYVDDGIPAILGTIIQGNTLVNCNAGVYLNTESYLTTLRANTFRNVANTISDLIIFPGISHASVNTTVVADL